MKANFSEVFNEIYGKHGKELESLRKQVLYKTILLILVNILGGYIFFKNVKYISPIVVLCLPIFAAIDFFVLIKISKKYIFTFKQKAVKSMVECSITNSNYISNSGVTASDYNASRFDTRWDDFYSEDYVDGYLADDVKFKMSQVKTTETREYVDNEGHRQRETTITFFGLYGFINLPVSFANIIMIEGNSIFRKFNKNRVEMESSEFEKYFDVSSPDRLNVMEVLTQDTIEKLINLRNEYKKDIKIKLDNSKIYFRIACGDIFEPPTFKSAVGFDILKKYFAIVQTPAEIYDMFIDNLALTSRDDELLHKRRVENMNEEERKTYKEAEKKKEESSWFSH